MKAIVEVIEAFSLVSAVLVFIYLGISGLSYLWDIVKPLLHQITA